jgi:DnaJ-class molecular chaperone
MDLRQAYKILELPENSSMYEVKQAYRDLAQIWHPDRQAQNERLQRKSLNKMKELNAAYDCICHHLDAVKTAGFSESDPKHGNSNENIVICPECGTKNMSSLSANNSGAKCGRCGSYLLRKAKNKQIERFAVMEPALALSIQPVNAGSAGEHMKRELSQRETGKKEETSNKNGVNRDQAEVIR